MKSRRGVLASTSSIFLTVMASVAVVTGAPSVTSDPLEGEAARPSAAPLSTPPPIETQAVTCEAEDAIMPNWQDASCRTYFRCDEQVAYKYSCAIGQAYSAELDSCVEFSKVECEAQNKAVRLVVDASALVRESSNLVYTGRRHTGGGPNPIIDTSRLAQQLQGRHQVQERAGRVKRHLARSQTSTDETGPIIPVTVPEHLCWGSNFDPTLTRALVNAVLLSETGCLGRANQCRLPFLDVHCGPRNDVSRTGTDSTQGEDQASAAGAGSFVVYNDGGRDTTGTDTNSGALGTRSQQQIWRFPNNNFYRDVGEEEEEEEVDDDDDEIERRGLRDNRRREENSQRRNNTLSDRDSHDTVVSGGSTNIARQDKLGSNVNTRPEADTRNNEFVRSQNEFTIGTTEKSKIVNPGATTEADEEAKPSPPGDTGVVSTSARDLERRRGKTIGGERVDDSSGINGSGEVGSEERGLLGEKQRRGESANVDFSRFGDEEKGEPDDDSVLV